MVRGLGLAELGRGRFIDPIAACLIAALDEMLGQVDPWVSVTIPDERLAGRPRGKPDERSFPHPFPDVNQVSQHLVRSSCRARQRDTRVPRQVRGIECVNVLWTGCYRTPVPQLNQPVPKLLAPARDVTHQEGRWPARGMTRLRFGLPDEPPFGFSLRLEQAQHVLHSFNFSRRKVSSGSVKADTPSYSATADLGRVSSLELFFDLVFVFTITQLTSLLARDPSITGLAQVVLVFGNVWWMYGGYAWLTNAVPPVEVGLRLLLLLGMGGFLLVALAIPTVFGGGALAFGIGYMLVTLIHTWFFLRASQQSILSAMARLGPFNLVTAGLLLVAGFVRPVPRRWRGPVSRWRRPLWMVLAHRSSVDPAARASAHLRPGDRWTPGLSHCPDRPPAGHRRCGDHGGIPSRAPAWIQLSRCERRSSVSGR